MILGRFCFKGVIYDFDNVLLRMQNQLNSSERAEIKKYMKSNGGIRVYKDGFRVFNYGEAGIDMLELDLKRVNRPAGKISSNQLLAAIMLARKDSTGLIEKTNREGFINNLDLSSMKEMLDEVLGIISNLKQDDKTKLTRAYLEKANDRRSIEDKIDKVKKIINSANLDEKEKAKINLDLDKFSQDFSQAKDIFLSAASTGLNLAIVIHELDKSLVI